MNIDILYIYTYILQLLISVTWQCYLYIYIECIKYVQLLLSPSSLLFVSYLTKSVTYYV